ncbi:3-oxoacyl-ACP reductase FabG [Timonella sp. A28]|uniref:3-oxoacyl-ACP reductase FabG n=1 Tax=Timonella sp. A28 TaxID=3442640 RepID=UPI003EBF214B
MFSLKNRVAIVTGGASGIGRGIVESLVEAGATVVIADLNEAAAQHTAQEVGAHAKKLDVTNREQVRTVFAEVHEEFGQIDVLCANAGIFPQAGLDTLTDEQWDTIFTVNTKSTFITVQEALKFMKPRKYGRIVITTSITGSHTGYPGWSHYGATKAAQQGFMRGASLEVARDGITINGVLPGNILTDGLRDQGEEYLAQMARGIPALRLGDPRDIGNAAAFLASTEAGYITGQTLIVDGGQILPESPEAILQAE